jgi:hypothetical protein
MESLYIHFGDYKTQTPESISTLGVFLIKVAQALGAFFVAYLRSDMLMCRRTLAQVDSDSTACNRSVFIEMVR